MHEVQGFFFVIDAHCQGIVITKLQKKQGQTMKKILWRNVYILIFNLIFCLEKKLM